MFVIDISKVIQVIKCVKINGRLNKVQYIQSLKGKPSYKLNVVYYSKNSISKEQNFIPKTLTQKPS